MSSNGTILNMAYTMHQGCIVVHPVGTLETGTYARLRDDLLKYAAEGPDAVLVELDSLHIEREHLLSVFSLVWMRISDWPGVPIVLLSSDLARRERLWRAPVTRYVPVYADVDDALAVGLRPPRPRRTHVSLQASSTASRQARRVLRQTAQRWDIEGSLEDVQQVVTELVENALKHTAGGPSLRFELRRGMLSIAVTDDSPQRPFVRAAAPQLDSGRGLHLVAEFATAWGSTPTLSGGKVVWAVVPVNAPCGCARFHDE